MLDRVTSEMNQLKKPLLTLSSFAENEKSMRQRSHWTDLLLCGIIRDVWVE